MSIESMLIARARGPMLAERTRAALGAEISKGCLPKIDSCPVPLEPPFAQIHPSALGAVVRSAIPTTPPGLRTSSGRAHVWIAPSYQFDWRRVELFVKQLRHVSGRLALELSGNAAGVLITLFFHESDRPIVTAAFDGQFESCVLSSNTAADLRLFDEALGADIALRDYYPLPPYSRLVTGPEELHYSPYEPLLVALSNIPPPAIGLYQAVFQPTHPDHSWNENIEYIQDMEYTLKLWEAPHTSQRMLQQAPSGDLRHMAWEVETKAHSDKPIYAAALRTAVAGAGPDADAHLSALSSVVSLFQHGGRGLRWLTEEDYLRMLAPEAVREMLEKCLTYRHGFLVNSQELAGLSHIPPAAIISDRRLPMPTIVRPDLRPAATTTSGVRLGVCRSGDRTIPVSISPEERSRHVHIIGVPGMGKSSAMESMALQDIAAGCGVAVLDPHGDLIDRLLGLIPDDQVDRTIYFNPGDPEWVPLWNVLAPVEGQDAGRAADDLVAAFKSIVTGWGDRLEHLLRHAFFALFRRPGSTLMHAAQLLRGKSSQSRRLRDEILNYLENPLAQEFWKNDFERYRAEDLAPVQHKLSKLLVSDTVSRMLAQSDSRISLKEVMEDRLVFLADLSSVGPETREVLGKLLLSFFHLNALSRSRQSAAERSPFYIYCDEAHRFLTDAIEDLLAETRKFGIGLTLAHQYLSQFDRSKVDALCSVGTTLAFRVDGKDATFLTKDFMGKVSADEFVTLPPRTVIARMEGEIVQFQTEPLPTSASVLTRDRVIDRSRQRYCLRAADLRSAGRKLRTGFFVNTSADPGSEFVYDEF